MGYSSHLSGSFSFESVSFGGDKRVNSHAFISKEALFISSERVFEMDVGSKLTDSTAYLRSKFGLSHPLFD